MAFKRQSYFFSPQDDAEFSRLLRAAYPQLRFRDGQSWNAQDEVPYRDGIESCDSGLAYIWNPAIFPEVPCKLINGQMQGASTGYVIQFGRCRIKDGRIGWGQMAASFDAASSVEKQYMEKVFRILKKLNANSIRVVDASSGDLINPKATGFVLGRGAATLVRDGYALAHAIGTRLEIVDDVA